MSIFTALLAENNRLKQYKGILSAFNTIMAGHRGDLICEVTSAKVSTFIILNLYFVLFEKKKENKTNIFFQAYNLKINGSKM